MFHFRDFYATLVNSGLKIAFMDSRASLKLTAISSAGVLCGALLIYISVFHGCILIYGETYVRGLKV
jgi:hypothetical protein